MVKECMEALADTLFEGKEGQQLKQKVRQIPLSSTTTTRRAELLSEDVQSQLDSAIQSAPCIALAADESTDVSDNAQLLVYVRFYNEETKTFVEDILGVTALKTHTRGEDIYLAIKEMLTQRRIDVKNVVSITTDGAPSMMGREKGAVSRLKEDNPELLSYHCIIHLSVLCSTLSEHHAEVMNTITKLVNFLRASSAHQHRLLREFLAEVDAPANDLLLHSNVRWLSKGKVLARFWKIRNEIKDFLAQQKSHKAQVFLQFLEEESNMDTLAFLVDITGHLNDLNLKLQGKDNSVCDLVAAVQSFQRKLDILKMDLEQDCTHFPSMKEIQDSNITAHSDFIQKLIENFKAHFDGFSLGDQLMLFVRSPFLVKNVISFSKEAVHMYKWANAQALQMELLDLQADVVLREQCESSDPVTFWLQTVPKAKFPVLHKVDVYTLTMFGSTYCCESAFSTLNIIKNKYRSQLTNDRVHACLRIALTPFLPRFKRLAASANANFSH
ncbi:SCAN domain-containing protein 3-like [Paramisgurnus dabryanus]|uniref:SCAN domain-containing protein 3-like n=1 Tax=Paramisgurnus dabryanus TaxID=90735 RepID=UPI0031F35E94